ncbi:unnamed protein product [Lampetra planeri]
MKTLSVRRASRNALSPERISPSPLARPPDRPAGGRASERSGGHEFLLGNQRNKRLSFRLLTGGGAGGEGGVLVVAHGERGFAIFLQVKRGAWGVTRARARVRNERCDGECFRMTSSTTAQGVGATALRIHIQVVSSLDNRVREQRDSRVSPRCRDDEQRGLGAERLGRRGSGKTARSPELGSEGSRRGAVTAEEQWARRRISYLG